MRLLRLPKYRNLDKCFEMFGLIHQVVTSRRTLRQIVIEAVEDFYKDNVKYLELRSTPRDLPKDGASRADYVDEVSRIVTQDKIWILWCDCC